MLGQQAAAETIVEFLKHRADRLANFISSKWPQTEKAKTLFS